MAHADYNCCAVCDCKLHYVGYDSETKEEICDYCLKELRDMGIHIITACELVDWIKNTDSETVEKVLKSVGYSACYYPNDVDFAVEEKLPLIFKVGERLG